MVPEADAEDGGQHTEADAGASPPRERLAPPACLTRRAVPEWGAQGEHEQRPRLHGSPRPDFERYQPAEMRPGLGPRPLDLRPVDGRLGPERREVGGVFAIGNAREEAPLNGTHVLDEWEQVTAPDDEGAHPRLGFHGRRLRATTEDRDLADVASCHHLTHVPAASGLGRGAGAHQEEPVADTALVEQHLAGIELDLVGGHCPPPDLRAAQAAQERMLRQAFVAVVPADPRL